MSLVTSSAVLVRDVGLLRRFNTSFVNMIRPSVCYVDTLGSISKVLLTLLVLLGLGHETSLESKGVSLVSNDLRRYRDLRFLSHVFNVAFGVVS